VQRIWQKHNRSHLSTDYSFYSSTAYLVPMHSHMSYGSFSNSFNNSFTFSSGEDHYPCYQDSKLEQNNKRIFEINYANI